MNGKRKNSFRRFLCRSGESNPGPPAFKTQFLTATPPRHKIESLTIIPYHHGPYPSLPQRPACLRPPSPLRLDRPGSLEPTAVLCDRADRRTHCPALRNSIMTQHETSQPENGPMAPHLLLGVILFVMVIARCTETSIAQHNAVFGVPHLCKRLAKLYVDG